MVASRLFGVLQQNINLLLAQIEKKKLNLQIYHLLLFCYNLVSAI